IKKHPSEWRLPRGVIQFHNLIPVSWKNLTVTVALSGALMSLSASIVFPWIVMDHYKEWQRCVAASVVSCLTFLAYSSESYILRTQAQEQRGYMGSMPGLLKIFQLWGGCQMIVLVVEVVCVLPTSEHRWQLWVTSITYAICVLTCFATVVVILGDCAGRCLLPFDKCLGRLQPCVFKELARPLSTGCARTRAVETTRNVEVTRDVNVSRENNVKSLRKFSVLLVVSRLKVKPPLAHEAP
ncbi:unnamed protein product, partial [Pleuronectes platessa]